MLKGFKEFILRGNVIDLAVAVVIGAAFGAIVNTIVTSIITPLIAALFNADSIAKAGVVDIPTASGKPSPLLFGAVLAAVINFLIVAVVVYFAFVVPVNFLKKRADARKAANQPAVAADTPPTELELLTDIRNLLASGAATRSGSVPPSEPGRHVE